MSAANEGKKKPVATFVLLGALLLLAVGVRWWSAREPGTTLDQAPAQVQGYWTASDARYAGRGIEVSPTTVVLHRGEADPLVGRLSAAREFTDDGDRVVRLEYETSEGPSSMEMVTRADGTMNLRNQPSIVWSSDGPTPTGPLPTMVDAPSPAPGGGLPVRLVLAALLGVGVLGVVGLWLAGGSSATENTGVGLAPNVVRGVWTTMDARLEGRTIRIAPGYAFSQFGPGDIRVGGVITNAQVSKEDGQRIVSLEVQRPEGPERLELALDRSGHMRLLDGPKSVWVKR